MIRDPGVRTKGKDPMAPQRISAAGDPLVFGPASGEDSHPHVCNDGLVFLTYTVWDELVGEEVERIEAVPCRRCAEAAPDAQDFGTEGAYLEALEQWERGGY
jgi:hypothetical protein